MTSEAEKLKTSEWHKIVKVIVQPVQAFYEIKENPRFLIPALIILILTLASTLITLPELLDLTREQMNATGQVEGMETALDMMVGGSAIIGVLFTVPLIWLLKAVVLLIYDKITIGEAQFKNLFSVAVYSGIPGIFSLLVNTTIIKSLGYKSAMQVNTSLGLLMGNNTEGFLYRFLSQVEFFSVWGLILLVIGGAIMMKKKALNVGAYVFALWLLMSLGIAALGGLFPTAGLK